MSIFEKRTTAPSKAMDCYGVSNPFYQSGYGMPNCTAYAYGRFWELLGSKPNLSLANAENWYSHNDEYERGLTPRLGAIICYRKGQVGVASDGAGHVAVVEEIYSDGRILISESAWKGSFFKTKILDKNYNYGTLKFQGFIYNPRSFEQPVDNSVENSSFKVGVTYETNVVLKVRTGAGTDKSIVPYENLTANAKEHSYKTGANKGCLKVKTKVTCQGIEKVGNDIWLKIPSGYIAGIYQNKKYVS